MGLQVMNEPLAHILLVDDQERNLDVLQAILSNPDYCLVRATSGEEALLALLRQEFAVVVLDIRMPGVSGLELAALIKQRRRTQHVPIIFLTAHLLDDKDVLVGYGVGAVDYLSKPINPDILRSKVGVFVELFRKTRALTVANLNLESEIAERQKAQDALSKAKEALEVRVAERTADLLAANQALRQSEERLRDAHRSLSMAQRAGGSGVWDWDCITEDAYVSDEFRDLYGIATDEPFSLSRWLSAIHPDDRDRLAAAHAHLLEAGDDWNEEFRIIHPRLGERWLSGLGRVIRDANGRALRFCGINLDITDRKRTEQELETYRTRLEQLVAEQTQKLTQSLEQLRQSERLASVGTLATGIAHEINNPLNAILLATEYSLTISDPSENQSTLESIRSEAMRAGKIVKNLLKFTRRERTTKTPHDINTVVQHVAALIRSYLPSMDLALELELADGLPTCAINPTEIEQVVVNLIKNAAEAQGDGRVTVRTACVHDFVHISVEDDGPGIPVEFRQHIFDPFFTTKRTAGGTGLGLSLSHGIIAEHGGRISLNTEVGRGTTFTVELPVAQSAGVPACQES